MKAKPLLTKSRYAQALKYAKTLAVPVLKSDSGYADAKVNSVALESMVFGWITAQPYFLPWRKQNQRAHPRDAWADIVQDFALQVTSDATHGLRLRDCLCARS